MVATVADLVARSRFVVTLGALVALVAQGPAHAGLHQWSSGGPAVTGPVLSLAVDPTDPLVVYAGTGISGGIAGTVFKSLDGGLTWNPANTDLPSGFIRGLAIDPQAPGTLYAASTGSVFKSTNGGGNWVQKNTAPAPGTSLTVVLDPQQAATVYVGTTASQPNNLFKSTNGGETWQPIGNGLAAPGTPLVNAVAVDPLTSSIVYAGTQSGLFKSTDGGQSWSPMNNGFTPDPTPSILTLVIDPLDTAVIYVGTGGFGVWKSTDAGASWTAMNTGLTDSLVNDLAMDPQRHDVLYLVTSTGGAFRTIDGGQHWSHLNVGLEGLPLTAIGISQTGTCVHAGTNNAGNSHVFEYSLVAGCAPLPPLVPPLVAAVLPSSRSVQVNHPATAFVTIINAGSFPATGVSIGLALGVSATSTFQITDPATNLPAGTQNVPADIPAGGTQTYLIAVTPTTALAPTEAAFVYAAENTVAPAATLVGINTLLLSASFSVPPDIVALALTLSNDGIVNIVNGSGALAVATVNVGASASITASADTGGAVLPVTLFICQTNPANGLCLTSLDLIATVQINGGETPTFTVLVAGGVVVPFDPAVNRIFVRFKDGGGVTRGSTSVAVRTL